jgi:hypothetical protein
MELDFLIVIKSRMYGKIEVSEKGFDMMCSMGGNAKG